MNNCLCCDEPLDENQLDVYCWKCTSGVGWMQFYSIPTDHEALSAPDSNPSSEDGE